MVRKASRSNLGSSGLEITGGLLAVGVFFDAGIWGEEKEGWVGDEGGRVDGGGGRRILLDGGQWKFAKDGRAPRWLMVVAAGWRSTSLVLTLFHLFLLPPRIASHLPIKKPLLPFPSLSPRKKDK